MSHEVSLRWLFIQLPVDPDAVRRPGADPLPLPAAATLVAIGGVAGSLARAWIAVALPHARGTWPWSTILVNLVGSGLLAFFLVMLVERFPTARTPRPLIGTGVIGGFTTFSTFAVDAVELAHDGRPWLACAYVLTSLGGGALAGVVGLLAARTCDRLLDRERWSRRVRHARQQTESGET